MIVKAVDIARELGVSKATVSLALNNKPGVNEKTKQAILECKARLEQQKTGQGTSALQKPGEGSQTEVLERANKIKVIVFNAGLRYMVNSELDLWTDVKEVFDRIAKQYNYEIEITYFYMGTESVEKLHADCNRGDVAGVIAIATELSKEDLQILDGILKPLVVYDCNAEDMKYPCVVADNVGGVRKAVKRLLKQGAKNIVYLAKDRYIYNTLKRREGFTETMRAAGDREPEKRIVLVGETIEAAYERIGEYVDTHELPDAFIAESYQMSISGIRVLQERGIQIPEQVKFIGVDELPAYVTMGYNMTSVRIPHTERAKLTMMLLNHEMHEPSSRVKSEIYARCQIIDGETA